MNKPSLPKGTRDFSPSEMRKRKYILDNIKEVFEKYSFEPIETPAMEQLSVLTGKYGEEGDKLLFKILNSGDFLSKASPEGLAGGHEKLGPQISEKGLRYDLTVPFARYVVMNRNDIQFPFRRYQIQPVWRADRPQKGRYREFWQCDADIVGSDSLVCEAELAAMVYEVFERLNIKKYTLRFNNRKILTALAEKIGQTERSMRLFTAVDKLDKIGMDGVLKELDYYGFDTAAIPTIQEFLTMTGSNELKINQLKSFFEHSVTGQAGLEELNSFLANVKNLGFEDKRQQFDLTLARGLGYYTGTIFEITIENSGIGSVSGGGRYDNLTGVFGMPGLSGVGISFGIDRLVDALNALDLFPEMIRKNTQVLVANFGKSFQEYSLRALRSLRDAGIKAIFYADEAKLKKQLSYADSMNIKYALIIGEEEQQEGVVSVKNLKEGTQNKVDLEQFIQSLN